MILTGPAASGRNDLFWFRGRPISDDDFNARFERNFFSRVPLKVAQSFTDEQMSAIKQAFGAERWDGHRVDLRGVVPLPFRRWYFAFVAGPDRRAKRRPRAAGEAGAFGRVVSATVTIITLLLLLLVLIYAFTA